MTDKARFFTVNDKKTNHFMFDLPDTWWSRKYEYEWVQNFVDKDDVVLDAASGVFHPLKYFLADNCKEVYSCDIDKDIEKTNLDDVSDFVLNSYSISREQLKVINKNSYFQKIHNKCCSITNLPYEDKKFDKIYCISVLEHLRYKDMYESFKEFKRVLKDDGQLILTFDYPDISLDYLQQVMNMLHLEFTGDVDFKLPDNAIYSDHYNIYCFRAVVRKIQCPAKIKDLTTNTIPKIIHYCWFGTKEKTELVTKCIESWKKHLPGYVIWEWNNQDLLECNNRYALEAFSAQKWAFITDYFRLHALYKYGGIYFDSDNEVFKSFDNLLDLDFFTGYENSGGNVLPFTAVVASKSQNEIVGDLLQEYDNLPFLINGVPNLCTNTDRVTNYFKRNFGVVEPHTGTEKVYLKDKSIIFPCNYFCNYDGDVTYAVHHFSGSWLDFKKAEVNLIKPTDSKYACKITAIIPILEENLHLKDALTGIFNQTFKDFEVIIADCTNSKQTLEIVNNFDNNKIKIIKIAEKNLGLALNDAIEVSSGEYIARINVDDFSLPDKFRALIGYMDQYTEVGVCGSFVKIFDSSNKNFQIVPYVTEHDEIKGMLLFNESINYSSLIFRKSLFEKYDLKYSSELLCNVDYEMLMRASDCLIFSNLPQPLVLKVLYQSTKSYSEDEKASLLKIVQKNLNSRLNILFPDNLIDALWLKNDDEKYFSYDDLLLITDYFKQLIHEINLSQDYAKISKELEKILMARLNYLLGIASRGFIQQDYHNKDKKILIVSHELSNTGAPLILLQPIQILQKHGYSVTLLSYLGGPLEETLKKMQVPVVISPESFSKEELFAKIANSFGLVWANTILTYPVSKFLKDQNKVIWWLHEGKTGKEFVSKAYPEALSVLPVSNNVYAVSEYSRNEFLDYNGSISILKYGFEDSFVSADKIKKTNDKVKLLMLGSIERRKAHDVVLRAIELLPEKYKNMLSLDISGESTDSAWYDSLTNSYKHLSNVKWHGFVSVDDKHELLKNADLLLCVSRDDPAPKVVAEAMMMTKACLVSKNVGQCSLISDAENGFVVETDNAVALKEKIIEIINLKDRLVVIGQKAREIYMQNYRFDIFEKNLIEIVNKAIDLSKQNASSINNSSYSANEKKIIDKNLNYVPSSNKKITVAYLAYYNNQIGYDISIVENFLALYNKYPAGIEHELVILAKNWSDDKAFDKLCNLAKDNGLKVIYLPDDGFDIGAYFRASDILKSEYVYFIGSNIEICAENWLKYSYEAFKKDKSIGLVGAMGSYEEGRSGIFPNPHIRTTCFMIKNELFNKYANSQKFPQTKEDTWDLEHCKNSLSNFVVNSGLSLVVVNSDGEIFYPDSWPYSETYISNNNAKKIMSDKWARRYETAEDDFKPFIEKTVWGENTTIFMKDAVKDFDKDITIFTPYTDRFGIFSNKIFHPILIGKFAQNLKTGAIKGDSLINIAEKIDMYGELTAYYWVWKNFLPNSKQKYVGFNQICRALDYDVNQQERTDFIPIFKDEYAEKFANYSEEKIIECIEDYDVIIPYKTEYKFSVYEQYLIEHSKADFDIALDVIEKFFPKYIPARNEVMSSNYLYGMCAFVMRKELLDEFLTWLFDLLNKVEERINNSTSYGKYSDLFSSRFMAERFFNIWLVHKINNDNIKIKSTSSYTIYFNTEEYNQALSLKSKKVCAAKG